MIESQITRVLVVQILFAMIFTAAQVQPALAQGKGKRKPGADGGAAAAGSVGSTAEIVSVSGKLENVVGSSIKILSEGNVETYATIDQRSAVRFSGQAKPSWLSQGMMVRFSARIDGNGRVEAPLKSLDVFVPETRGRMSQDEMRNQTPGMHPEGSAIGAASKDLFTDKKPGSKSDKKRDKQSEPKTDKDKKSTGKNTESGGTADPAGTPQTYRVVGNIVGAPQQNSLLINAGGSRVSVELDPAVVINVTAPNLFFASQGDTVRLSGLRFPNKNVYAESLEVKAAKQLGLDGGPASKNARGSLKNSKSTDKSSKKGKDSADTKSKLPKNGN